MKRMSLLIALMLVSALMFGLIHGAPAVADEGSSMKMGSDTKEGSGGKLSGAGMWDYLKAEDYASNWKLYPGSTALYEGTFPHGDLLSVYVNGKAHAAIEEKVGSLPEGAIVVKENYSPEKELKAITIMYKSSGYNPEANDWFWAKYTPAGEIQAEGKAEMCIACHGQKKDNDFIMRSPLK